MARHRVYFPDLPEGPELRVEGEEAHHALRVKRLESGDPVDFHDGQGTVVRAVVAEAIKSREGWVMVCRVQSRETRPRPGVRLRVLASAPKGDRLDTMIDALAQVGAESWGPLHSARTVVEPREGKLARLERTATEAMKQCGSAWRLEISPGVDLRACLAAGAPWGPGRLVIADASGQRPRPVSGEVTLLVGPEGGWAPEELEAARDAGATVVAFGVNIMRTEVAAVVAAARLMEA